MKTLVFGGTFNPPHIGHTVMCRAAAEHIGAERIIIMPTYIPPHKSVEGSLAAGEHRINMCRLAFEDIPGVCVSNAELSRGGKSYTFDTLTDLHRLYPDDDIYFLCGADMFLSLHTWYRAERLPQLATFCVVPRDGGAAELREYERSHEFVRGRCIIIDIPPVDASSTEVRESIHSGKESASVSDAVSEYIAKNGLYR